MKNAYQRRRVKARVEKRARMKKLDAITLSFAREVIEEETGAPLEIGSPRRVRTDAAAGPGEARLVARDDKKNPLISTFDWTADATQRIMRVPAGFMRNKTQERIEELARERGHEGDRPGAGRGRDRARQEDDGRNDLDLLPADIDEREAQPQRGQPADGARPAEA